jgi:hypothetical protein
MIENDVVHKGWQDGPNLGKGLRQFELGKLIEDGGCFYWKSGLRNTSTNCPKTEMWRACQATVGFNAGSDSSERPEDIDTHADGVIVADEETSRE